MADIGAAPTDRAAAGYEGWRYALMRGAAAGAVGALLGAVVAWIQVDEARCEARVPPGQGNGWECAGGPLLALAAGPVVAPLLSWLLLRCVRVRPAWAVALPAPLLAVPLYRLGAWAVTGRQGDAPAWVVVVTTALAYAATGLLVAPRLLPRIRWAAGGVLFVLAGLGILLGGATGW
nr:hypothetical protein [Streptomyces sp. TLI_235]